MTFNQRKSLCWLTNGCFAIAAFCFAMSPAPPQNRLLHASGLAILTIVLGLVWSQLATSAHAEATAKEPLVPN